MKGFALVAAAAGVAAIVLGGGGLGSAGMFGSFDIDVGAGPFEPDAPLAPRVSARAISSCSGLRAPTALPLFVLGHYEGATLSTAWLGDEDEEAHVVDIEVDEGEPIHFVVSAYGRTIYRFSGATERIARLTLMNRQGAGAVGIPAPRIAFTPECLPEEAFRPTDDGRERDPDPLVRALYGRSAKATAGHYDILRVRLTDRIEVTAAPHVSTAGADPETQELHRFSSGGISRVDAASVVSAVPVAPYRVLPQEAGVRQLVMSGALERTPAAHYGHYRVVRPIRMPAGLCGAHSIHLSAPNPTYISGDPCHSTIRYANGSESSPFSRLPVTTAPVAPPGFPGSEDASAASNAAAILD